MKASLSVTGAQTFKHDPARRGPVYVRLAIILLLLLYRRTEVLLAVDLLN